MGWGLFVGGTIFIVVVDAEKRPRKGENFAESHKYRTVDFAWRLYDEGRNEQPHPDKNKKNGSSELKRESTREEFRNFHSF